MEKPKSLFRLVLRKIKGSSRFGVKVVLIDPDSKEPIKGKKSKKERRRIRKKYESEKKPKAQKKPESGRSLKYIGTGRKR